MKETLKSPGRPVCLALMEFNVSPLYIQSETIWWGGGDGKGNPYTAASPQQACKF